MDNKKGFGTLQYELEERTLVIRLNRPRVSNAISTDLLSDLKRTFLKAETDDAVKVVIVTGEGKNFSVGADLTEAEALQSIADYDRFFEEFHDVYGRIERFEKPTIAAINGLALGGGCELCLVCDLRIAANNAALGLPEIKFGTLPGAGATQRLPRLVGPSRALEMLYTGNTISAEEAYRAGLINKVVPPEELMDAARALADRIRDKSRTALRMAKMLVRGASSLNLGTGLAFEKEFVTFLSRSREAREGFKAFVERRKTRSGKK